MQTPPNAPQLSAIDDVTLAERQVTLRKAELARSLHQAENTGKKLAQRLGREMKPALMVALAVAGAAAVTAVAVTVTRRRRRSSSWLAPERTSALGVAARSAGLWLLRLAARRVAEELAQRLAEPTLPATESVATSPNQV